MFVSICEWYRRESENRQAFGARGRGGVVPLQKCANLAICGEVQTKHPTVAGWVFVFGGAEEDRTPDLRIANATLSQLSYRPVGRILPD